MPFPTKLIITEGHNRLIQDELYYDRTSLKEEHENLCSRLTIEQKEVYETIMNVVSCGEGGVFFIYGYGGTGKTYIWRTLSAGIRSKGDIVLTVASSGIVLLLSGGRTAHSKFVIPINVNEDSTCNIKPGIELAQLIEKAKLIIWDKAPMIHRFCFVALDKSLRDILKSPSKSNLDQPFGGKVIVFRGDFRQILPVIPKGSRQDIVFATISSSYLWSFCKVLRLTRNMKLEANDVNNNLQELKEFSEWILNDGDGLLEEENEGEAVIQIPYDILIKDTINPVASITDSTYPSFLENLMSPHYFLERTILAPTNENVESLNDYLMSKLEGEERIYYSSDSIAYADGNVGYGDKLYSPDFLNSIRCSRLSNHKLRLKIGVPVMLIININQQEGLCNGTRLQVCRMGNHVIEARIITGCNIGHKVFIPRMVLSPSDSKFPFKMHRR